MSKPCNKCGDPIEFKNERGRWVPINADGAEHRTTCLAQRGQVDGRLKWPTGHHVSQYRVKRFLECQRQSYFADVLKLEGADSSPEMQAGKLVHACLEFVAVEAAKAGQLAEPVTPERLLSALETVVGREEWSSDALGLARTIVGKQAEPLDLSFAYADEHGVAVERKFELPCGGDGVIAGGVVDLIERVGDETFLVDWKTGAWRDDEPHKSPQAGLYLAWGRATFGPKVRFVLRYLALEGPADEVFWTRELEENAKAFARALVTKSRMQREDEDAWPASYGSHCARCPFTARCETYQAKAASKLPDREPVTLPEIAAELEKWEPVASVAGSYVDRLRKAGKQLAAEELGTSRGALVVGDFNVTLSSHTRKPEEKPRAGGSYQLLKIERLKTAPQVTAAGVVPSATVADAGPLPERTIEETQPAPATEPLQQGLGRATPSPEARPLSAARPAGLVPSGSQNPETACAAAPGAAPLATKLCAKCKRERPDVQRTTVVRRMSGRCALAGDFDLCSECRALVEMPASERGAPGAPAGGEEPRGGAGSGEALAAGTSPAAASGLSTPAPSLSTIDRALELDPEDEEAPGPVPLCCACGKDEVAHRALVLYESEKVELHPDQCVSDVHNVVLDGVAIHYVCEGCWPKTKADLEALARAQFAEKVAAMQGKTRPAIGPAEDPKASVGFNEASLAWPCPVEGCGKKFASARGLNAHKRTHAGPAPSALADLKAPSGEWKP